MYKMYCVVSREALKEMKGIRGKMMTQAGHAFLHAYWDSEKRFPSYCNSYKDETHARKITLVVDSTAELEPLYDSYKDICGVTLVKDAGFTVFDKPTITCIGIGPIHEDEVKEDLKILKTLT